jgi:hypothetical protein
MDVEQSQCDSQVWGRWNDTHTSVTSPADRAGGSEGAGSPGAAPRQLMISPGCTIFELTRHGYM